MQLLTEYQVIFSELKTDTFILTPNQRLSRFVQSQYGLWRQQQGKTAWPSLRCSSLNLWIQSLWGGMQITGASSKAHCCLATPSQERALWLQAIEAESSDDLLSIESMVDLSIQAWRSLRLWHKTLEDLPEDAEEVALFKLWTASLQKRMQDKNLIDATDIVSEVYQCILLDGLKTPSNIVCIGFDELTPMDKSLFKALESNGVSILNKDVHIEAECVRVELADTETEVKTMARWAAKLVESEPDVSIGIVIPDLANIRPMVERIFTGIFEPQYILPNQPRHAPAFNLSAGQPLAQTALLSSALLALQLNKKNVDRDDLYKLLSSPFIGVEHERSEYIKLLRDLKQRNILVSLTTLRASAGSDAYRCPTLHQMLSDFTDVARPNKFKQLKCSEWAKVFNEQLTALGWPGDRTLDTLEYQQLQHWPALLIELGKLDRVLPGVDISRAISELSKLAYTPFHAQTSDSPVQVLGLLEAAGLQFDYLWVMGLDYRTWPEPSKPNPLIPVSLQDQWSMPRASMAKELAVAQKLTHRLSHSGGQVVFSSPLADGDQPLRPSPLIADEVLLDSASITLLHEPNYARQMLGAELEQVDDSLAPTLVDLDGIRGGTQILKNQAACAFRAFAKHRLYATVPESMQQGVSAIQRGNLVHNALELIWGELGTQQALLNLDSTALDKLVEDSITSAWLKLNDSKKIGRKMMLVEFVRTQKLILQWLDIEKERAPFRVKSQEKSQRFHVGGMPLTIRYDRMDELLEGNEIIVLDYKTGLVEIQSWAGERPDDPQVPLYCVSLLDQPVIAAVLAQLNIKGVAVKGLSSSPELIPGLKAPEDLKRVDLPSTWPDIQLYWKHNLERLASSFIHGDASVNPKSVSKACAFCDLGGLCRIGLNAGEKT